MRFSLTRTLAVAFVASLTLASSAGAETILQFTQTNPANVVTADAVGSTTTLTTSAPGFGGSIPVTIGNIGNVQLPPILTIPAFETFTGVTTTGPAVLAGGLISQPISGSIAITAAVGGAGINYLTVSFTGILSGSPGTGAPTLSASSQVAGQSVTYTSSDPRVLPFLPGITRDFSLAFSNVSPGLSITGTTISDFTGQNSGTFAAFIPEPASIVMAGTSVLAGLGCFGLRRFKASKA